MAQRSFPRVRFNTNAAIAGGEDYFYGELENISLNGVFIRTKKQVGIGAAADITLSIPTVLMPSGIKLRGTVVRVEENGIAYRFNTIDYETFALLKIILKQRDHQPTLDTVTESPYC